jgi:hypothetical protein
MEWWHDYNDVVPGWFGTYLSLEPAADLIQIYDTAIVPGLLQTEAYANEALRLDHAVLPEAVIKRLLEVRMRRQQLMKRPNGPTLWVLFDERALRRKLGNTTIMRTQLEHLMDIAGQSNNITIQVIPSDAEILGTLAYPLTLLRFRVHELPDVAYLEQLTSALYLHDAYHVSRYAKVLDSLTIAALQPPETVAYIREILRET